MTVCWTPLLLFLIMVERTNSAARLPNVSTDLNTNVDQDATQSSNKRSYLKELPDDVQLGCRELRAKRFISDGFCTSLRPIKEVVCAGFCMPIKEKNLPWYTEFTKYWARPKLREWRCVEAIVKLKKVQLMCENGETRTYKIKIVKSCRCKSYENEHNVTGTKKTKSKNKKKLSREERRRRRQRKEIKRRLRKEKKLERKRKKSQQKQQKKKSSKDSVFIGNTTLTV